MPSTPPATTRQSAGDQVPAEPLSAAVIGELRTLVVAGIPVGVVVVGVGGRLAMFILRITSSGRVRGLESDDGFVIGRFTLGGTYNLLMLGAAVGILGAAAYQWVRPWLLGPRWFRLATVALAAGAVVGSMLIHSDGIDFRLLTPTALAIALFVALPAIFALATGLAVEHVERTARRTRSATTWIAPALLVIAFPAVLIVLLFASVVIMAWLAVRDTRPIRALASNAAAGLMARAAWLAIAVVGLAALVNDIVDISAAT
jgi:hypothetical protein